MCQLLGHLVNLFVNSRAALGQSENMESRNQSVSIEAFRCSDAKRRTASSSDVISYYTAIFIPDWSQFRDSYFFNLLINSEKDI